MNTEMWTIIGVVATVIGTIATIIGLRLNREKKNFSSSVFHNIPKDSNEKK